MYSTTQSRNEEKVAHKKGNGISRNTKRIFLIIFAYTQRLIFYMFTSIKRNTEDKDIPFHVANEMKYNMKCY